MNKLEKAILCYFGESGYNNMWGVVVFFFVVVYFGRFGGGGGWGNDEGWMADAGLVGKSWKNRHGPIVILFQFDVIFRLRYALQALWYFNFNQL